MRSTFHGLETGKRALLAQTVGLNTLGHNVANANTEGYSRQRVNFATTPSMEYPGMAKQTEAGQIGTGVLAKNIERVREQFLDVQFRNENKAAGEWQMRLDTLDKIQAIVNEPSDSGLSTVLNKFYLSWQKLGANPDTLEARAVVKQATLDLVTSFNMLDAKIKELDRDIAESIGTKVDQVNSMTTQISALNKQIHTLEVLGDNANDLRDSRDLLVDKLSKLANVTTSESMDGTYRVMIGDQVVVNGQQPPVPVAYDAATNSTTPPIRNGEIGGLMASRVEYVKVYQDQFDSLVNGLVNGKMDVALTNDYTFSASETTLPFDVKIGGTQYLKGAAIPTNPLPKGSVITFEGLNAIHRFGYTMQEPTSKAGALFETADGSATFNLSNVRVAESILADTRNMSASFSTYTDANGDLQVKKGSGDIAFMISEANGSVINFKDGLPPNNAILTKGTVAGYLRAMVGQLGAQGNTAEMQVTNQDALIKQVDNRRQSVSGVSLDEEMSNMIKFQQSYAAAARVVSTVDTLLDTIINRMAAH
ncbi:flagellar hook-associated protein FlgK [Tumebacillus sp. DT12]|uniref:Flagellar hook-associated protein 1 n=1 Tax=Tumebacillus lacus TaxID=2995335 RepID=A0ABT3X0E1_9BACL|nr:flagellar hook-associated protein FlgK [Tumebacillus lacus]MCX7569472.1 flagellar hook-associated protein FlgK [Tumebacillus lacus]